MTKNDIKVAFFLTRRYIRGANIWTKVLITFVMILTFLNLTVIGGLLEGIIVGSFQGLRDRALGDIFIYPKEGESSIERSQSIIFDLENDERISSISPRIISRVEIINEREFFNILNSKEKRKSVSTTALGIDPEKEKATTNLDQYLIEGNYFSENVNRKEILVGSALLERYSPFGDDVLSDIYPGDSVFLRIGENENSAPFSESSNRGVVEIQEQGISKQNILQKYQVRGIFRTKASELDLNIVIHDDVIKGHSENPSNNVSTIAVRLKNTDDDLSIQKGLIDSGYGNYANIETIDEVVGPFLNDIRTVFRLLGIVVGSIGVIVSTIVIFIIIFVTAISRQKYIGILKGIGITSSAIRLSYVLYAMSYAIVGIGIGLSILYLLFVPFFNANPIPFPFSDGILYTTPFRTFVYIFILLITTLVAGFIPANNIVKKPAIESVRGR